MKKEKISLGCVNFTLFLIGMIGIWVVSHNLWALFWGAIASLHFSLTVKK